MEKRRITAEDLTKLAWVSDPVINPVSNRIAYVLKRVKEDKSGYLTNIRMVELDGSRDRTWTHGPSDSAPTWSPDGSLLTFLRKEGKSNQVWKMEADGGEAVVVTNAEHGVSSYIWSPDGKYMAYISGVDMDKSSDEQDADAGADADSKPKKQTTVVDRLMYKSDSSGLWDGKRMHLFVHELATGEVTALTTGHFDVSAFAWSSDSDSIVFTSKQPEDAAQNPDLVFTNDLFIIERTGGSARRLTDSSYSIGKPFCSPDGKTIGFLGTDRSYGNATLTRLYTLNSESGNVTCVTEHLDWQMGSYSISDMKAGAFDRPVFSQDGQFIYTLVSSEGCVNLVRFGLDGTYKQVTEGARDVTQFVLSADESEVVLASADWQQPCRLYRLNLARGTELLLTNQNEALFDELAISQPESFWVTTTDGWNVQGWMIPPVGMEAGRKYPTILEIHGGPHMMYANTFMHEFQLLAAQGYAVVFTNPRGGHGYGQQFVNAVRSDYGGRDYLDLMDAVDYVLANYDYVDETRLGVTGGSYGGFMTNWIVGHTNRFKAAVTQRSISNWTSMYGVSDIGYHFTEDQIGGQPWANLEQLWKQSPLAYVSNVETPLLILHGEQDLRCPIEQAEQLFIALKRLGKETQFVRFPGANHELSRSGNPELRMERLNRIVGWMNRFIHVDAASGELVNN
ncbi:S9 family peptidase [Paenibacillus sp. 481]|uniref:S9 family peptidase n=1 Tax=Paenibacillus sp. 481 TaxID=2835869 RepID=UPI001E649A2D|nr:S9 family peptidase [Paenibacillus sp. 481]UHA72735.1 S9 family peptidase [Paenibacillus sp. 481]